MNELLAKIIDAHGGMERAVHREKKGHGVGPDRRRRSWKC
jgi:hypothetical protein